MDVLDFINKGSKKEVPNPLFKPKAKKNIQPRSITVQDLNPDNDTAVNMAIADEINQYSIDSKIADRYRQEGINWNPWENLDAHFAEQQGNFSKFGNALAQAVVSELAIGTVKGISDLFDLTAIGLLLEYVVMWGPLALVIIFQPEIRSVLEQLGRSQLLGRHKVLTISEREKIVYEIQERELRIQYAREIYGEFADRED